MNYARAVTDGSPYFSNGLDYIRSSSEVSRVLRLAGLKAFVSRELHSRPVLRGLILHERDALTPEEYLAKMEIWLRLLESEH